MTWQDELKRKYRNPERAAAHFLPLWKRSDRIFATRVSEPMGLANKIRDLMSGKNEGWWAKRTLLLELIAADLGYELAELLGGPLALKHALVFPEAPSLKPLGAQDEPCRLGRSGWLLHQAVAELGGPDTQRWLLAPPGAGKTLVLRYLKQRHDREFSVVAAPTLEAATESVSSQLPLVVEIEVRDDRSDPAALQAFARRSTPTVIMAPFVPASSETSNRYFGPGQRRPPRSFLHGALPGWRIVEAELPAGWRERMIHWVDGRLEESAGDSKFDEQELLTWLAERDPDEVLIKTPGDLLALCAEVHLHGVDDADLREMAERWTSRVLAQPAAEASDARVWCRRVGAETFRRLARARVMGSVPLDRGLTPRAWEDVVPAASTPGSADGCGAGVAVAHLRELGLLRGAEDGALQLYPRWVMAGHAIEGVRDALEAESVESWGRLPVDASRRWIVDASLDGLSLAGFCTVVKEVLRHAEERDTLAVAGAIETVFSAAARRLAECAARLKPRERERWQRLAELQARFLLLDQSYGERPLPITRYHIDEWIADAWTFSLRLPCPPSWPEDRLVREFPGWASSLRVEQLDTMDLPWTHDRGEYGGPEVSRAARRVAEMASEILRRCVDKESPEKLSTILVPGLIEVAPEKKWMVRPEHVRALRGSWEQSFLVERLGATPRRDVMVERLWSGAVALAGDVASAIEEMTPGHAELLGFLLDHVPEPLFDETLAQRGFKTSAKAFARLPPRLRRTALLRWARPSTGRPPSFADAREMTAAFTHDDLDVLLELTTDTEANLAAELAIVVWRLSPQRAREETALAVQHHRPSAKSWFWAAPRSETPRLAVLAGELDENAAWLLRWARARLADGGDEADSLYRIVRALVRAGHGGVRG
ncbi:hypothetical protein WME95_44695 [Sorangium sp. So ce327]|uniref:hypothetical protein n=1 Tax=Sorangium sp. So ce327 TaxID=3133301 RepID=UPI003F6229EE